MHEPPSLWYIIPVPTAKSRTPLSAGPRPVRSSAAAAPRRPARPRSTAVWRSSLNRGAALRVLKTLGKWMLVLGLWGAIAVGVVVAFYAAQLPDLGKLTQPIRRPSVQLMAVDGTAFATYGDLHGEPIPAEKLPPHVIQSVVATEDRRFYQHFGFDPIGLARAAWANFRAGRLVQGGSTITQQVAKNLFLTPERTYGRKIQEVLLALWLEQRFTKNEILTLYFNRVYWGAGTYGIDAAARRYFDKAPAQLTLAEGATLAGMLKDPSRYSPARDPKRSRARMGQVLDNMVAAGFLEPARAEAAKTAPLGQGPVLAQGAGSRYFADWVFDQVADFIGAAESDVLVQTTFDPKLQRLAEAEIEKQLSGPAKKVNASQAALVSMSPDGAIRAMVGGRDYRESQFNRATQAQRQPGSAFKLFVFLAGLEIGMTPASTVEDAPITIRGWSPKNFDGRFRGTITFADAVAQSINTSAVRISERAGRHRVIQAAERLGITTGLDDVPSIALGTSEVTLLELTGAYAALPNGGVAAWPHAIVEVRDRGGQILYRRSGSGPSRVIQPEQVAMLNDMLSGVIRTGTGKAANIGRPEAGKTGTTQSSRDAWFVGYTADLVTGVWFGNDNDTAMRDVTGGGLPARAWAGFMGPALQGLPARPLPQPEGGGSFFGLIGGRPSASGAPTSLAPNEESDVRPSIGGSEQIRP
jgi:penicillin-binding protein 1A